ncbi:MAG: DUF5916 domain-containing protein [Chrysiogenia bacterium]
MKKVTFWMVLFFSIFALLLPQPQAAAKKTFLASRINPHPPVIDGKLTDPAWQHGEKEWGSGFIQRTPEEGKSPSQPTEFKILYDDKNLYIAIRAFDSEPEKIEKRLSRRDLLEGDYVDVQIDSYFDRRTAFAFAVNAAGVKRDKLIANDGGRQDENWDPNWTVNTAVDEMGWSAEMKIPFNQLRFADRPEMTWGLHVTRYIHRLQETSDWNLIPQNASGWASQFGELRGLSKIQPKKQIELLPYSLGKLHFSQQEEGNPFAPGRAGGLFAGVDGKIAVTNDLTLNFTINPDFGQVEADPSQVNLSAFESFFQEKRPFFVEGSNILNYQIMGGDGGFSMDNLFYSRRIGRRPHFAPELSDNEYADTPQNTSIYGALKLTGKTRNGWSLGILESLTGKEQAAIDFSGERRLETVEPATNYFLFRAQKDFRQGDTIIGGMLTAVNRNLGEPNLDTLHKAAFSGGLDIFHSWKKKTYYFSLKTVFSNVSGSKESIQDTQESPVHYFQRPDADHLAYDTEQTSLTGHGGTLSFGKQGGGRLNFSAGVTWRSPGLELNDMGYLRSSDRIMQWVWAGYTIGKPFAIFQRVYLNFNQWKGLDFGGNELFAGGNFSFSCKFKNYWSLGTGINVEGKGLSPNALRGGPALLTTGGWSHWFEIASDSRKKMNFYFGAANYWGVSQSNRFQDAWFGVTFRSSQALSISLAPTYSSNRCELQYVDTVTAGNEPRYVFAAIDQKVFRLVLRLNFSLTPDLSIQYYGQPFIASGNYSQFKHITDPRATAYANRFHVFTADEIAYDENENSYRATEGGNAGNSFNFANPDFKFLEFRSNLVLRWEFKPGTTLYLVWSQGRTQDFSNSNFTLGHDFSRIFSIYPENIFLVKFTYGFDL